jgi:hypothetical protein
MRLFNPYVNYGIFVGLLALLLISPEHNGYYLYGMSCLLIVASTAIATIYGKQRAVFKSCAPLCLATVHGIIHVVWPFLDKDGYNVKQTPFYDTTWHTLMFAYNYYLLRNKFHPLNYKAFHIVSLAILIGSIFNTFYSGIMDVESVNTTAFKVFSYSSIFQAMTVAYWICTMMWRNNYRDGEFIQHLLFWNIVIISNWVAYNMSDYLLSISMHYRYIEGLLITSSWIYLVS